jgi:glycosyltransferase involved in cell wall biosynthesis
MNTTNVSVVAHNIEFGGAATACRRLITTYQDMDFKVGLFLVAGQRRNPQRYAFRNLMRLRSAILSRLDSGICQFLEKNRTHWCSSGLLGQISARNVGKSDPLFVNIHWVGHATMSLRQIALLRDPVVITAHDEWWLTAFSHYLVESQAESNQFLVRKVRERVMNQKREILQKKNVGVVCLSEEMKEKFLSQYPFLNERITVIPNPVSGSVFYKRNDFESSHSTPKVAYLGGFTDKRKGYDLLFEALAKCEEKFIVTAPGFKGVLVTGKKNQIKVVGQPRITNEHEMNNLFNEAEITVVPSRKEALPQVATESLMAGTPVVSFQVGGLIDVVIDNVSGLKVANFDTNQLASMIDFSINSQLKKRISPDHFAAKIFSNPVVGEAYLSFTAKLK